MKRKIIIGFFVTLFVLIFCLFLEYTGIIWHNSLFAKIYPTKGLDVSSYQGQINWKEVARTNKYAFVYIKATEGHDYFDDYFKRNWIEAKKNGFSVGAYHFFSMRSSGKTQAKYFINFVPKEQDSLPPVIDIEINLNHDKKKVISELNDLANLLSEHYQKKPILYVTYETYNQYIKDDFSKYSIWIRDIIKYPALKNREWLIWQFNNRGRVNGIHTYVDINVINGSINKWTQNITKNHNLDYSLIFKNSDIVIKEKKLENFKSIYEIDASEIKRIKQTDIDISEDFECQWKISGQSTDCQISSTNLGSDSTSHIYKVREIKEDSFASYFQIYKDNNLLTEKKLMMTIETPIQAVKIIGGKFIVAFQTNTRIIPASEETGRVIKPEGYYSSVWIDGKDVLEGTRYIEAHSPFNLNNKLIYFIRDDKNQYINYNDKLIKLPYKYVAHYGCCEESQYNITSNGNLIDFFANKDDCWYHVQIIGIE